MQPVEPPPVPTPDVSSRRWIGVCAAAFLLFQLLLPLRYYLSIPTTDERFAWRMFSSVKMRDCAGSFYETVEIDGKTADRPVPPAMLLTWKSSLEQHRPDVVEKLMRWWCERPGVSAVRYERHCKAADGTDLPPTILLFERKTGAVRVVEGAAR